MLHRKPDECKPDKVIFHNHIGNMADAMEVDIVSYRSSYSYDEHLLTKMILPESSNTNDVNNDNSANGSVETPTLKDFVHQNRSRGTTEIHDSSSAAHNSMTSSSFDQGDLVHKKNVDELEDFNMKCYMKTKAELVSLAFSMFRTMGLIYDFANEKEKGEDAEKPKVGVDGHVLHRYLVAIVNTSVEDVPYHNCYHYFR